MHVMSPTMMVEIFWHYKLGLLRNDIPKELRKNKVDIKHTLNKVQLDDEILDDSVNFTEWQINNTGDNLINVLLNEVKKNGGMNQYIVDTMDARPNDNGCVVERTSNNFHIYP